MRRALPLMLLGCACAKPVPAALRPMPQGPPPPPRPQQAPRVAEPPAPVVAVERLLQPIAVEEGQLKNGLRVVAVAREGSPVTALAMVLPGGSALDEKHHGESLLAHSLYFGQGSGTRRADLIKKLTISGSDFDMDIAPDHVRLEVVGDESQLDEMMHFLALAATGGNVQEEDLERRKGSMVDELWETNRNPVRKAYDQIPDLAFGSKHPYGHTPLGTRATLATIDAARAKRHLERTLCPNGATIIASGPVRLERVMAVAKQRFGDWSKCRKPKDPDVSGTAQRRREVRIVHDGDRSQTLVLAALPVFGLDANGLAALELAGELLGGSVASRLQASLRAEGGYTYGVHTGVLALRGSGMLWIQTALDTERLKPALERLLEGVGSLATRPPDDEELARATRRFAAAHVTELRTAEGASGVAVRAVAAGHPIANPPLPDREAMAAFAAAHLRPEHLQLVLVGDARTLSDVVEEAALGAPRVVR